MPICKLCLDTVDELRDSHIWPKASYRLLRDEARDNPNPVWVQTGRVAHQTSKQVKERLLCPTCEQSLNRGGEAYIGQIVYAENGDCPIYDLVGHTSTVRSLPHPGLPIRVDASPLDVEKIHFFAFSVFWRSCVTCRVPGYTLGSKYEEHLRQFLNSEADAPEESILVMTVVDQPRRFPRTSALHGMVTAPTVFRRGQPFFSHSFFYLGLFFRLQLGGQVPRAFEQVQLRPARQSWVFFAAANQSPAISGLGDHVIKHREDHGRGGA